MTADAFRMPVLAQTEQPLFRWEYLTGQWDQIQAAILQHLQLTVLSVVAGLTISALLAAVALRYRWTMAPITGLTSILYTLPSVALFALLAPIFGNQAAITAVIPLTLFTLLILVTNIVAGFQAVPRAVKDAADGMGLTPRARVLGVELPLAMPLILAGIRIATVSTIGLVTVAGIIGQGGLGRLIFDGLRRNFDTPMIIGAVFSILLALCMDALLLLVGRLVTPWTKATRA
jgi:osmoprotectant transport system permease protein